MSIDIAADRALGQPTSPGAMCSTRWISVLFPPSNFQPPPPRQDGNACPCALLVQKSHGACQSSLLRSGPRTGQPSCGKTAGTPSVVGGPPPNTSGLSKESPTALKTAENCGRCHGFAEFIGGSSSTGAAQLTHSVSWPTPQVETARAPDGHTEHVWHVALPVENVLGGHFWQDALPCICGRCAPAPQKSLPTGK